MPATAPAQWVHVQQLLPWDRNPRQNEEAAASVAASIVEFGFAAPVVAWAEQQMVVAGHTRLKAMQRLLAQDAGFTVRGAPGPGMVPVRFHPFRSMQEAERYALADNRLGELAGWDDTVLADMLHQWDDAGLDAAVLGWDEAELSALVSTGVMPTFAPPEPLPAMPSAGDDRADTVVLVYRTEAEAEALRRHLGLGDDYSFKRKKTLEVRAFPWAQEAP